jgi:FkbM family methyltransferase
MIREIRREVSLACRVIGLHRNWPTVFLDRLHFVRPQPIVYHLRNGLELFGHTGTRDRFIIHEIFVDQVYTRSPGFGIRDDWIVADVGGHKGIFAVFAATRAKNVKVYSFEPSPQSFALLSDNIRRNGLSNVKAFNIAVTGKDGESTLYLHREAGQNTLLQRSDAALQSIGDAKVITWSLERVLKTIGSPISLLKMDIEGMEYEALFSCPSEVLQKVERIALEYHDDWVHVPHQVGELVDFLNGKGFATNLLVDRRILVAKRPKEIP